MLFVPQTNRQTGFSLLELIVVFVVIGIVAATSVKYFVDAMDKARATGVQMLAWRFAQSVSVLHAWSYVSDTVGLAENGTDARGVHWVTVDGVKIYLNEKRWPANADASRSPAIGQQTAEECEQLLNALLKQPLNYNNEVSTRSNQYQVSAVDGRVCRYQLAQYTEEAWFFDYNLETGGVSVSVPQFKLEQSLGLSFTRR